MTYDIVSLPSKNRRTPPKRGKTAPRRKNKEKTMTWYKKRADAVFSQYMRQKYADENGNIQCYTCPTIRPLKKMQNGHFVGRKYLGTRYEEKNCRPQCWYCNGHGYGNGRPVEFAIGLKKEYGDSIVADLYAQAEPLIRDFDYQAIIEIYTQKLAQLSQKIEEPTSDPTN